MASAVSLPASGAPKEAKKLIVGTRPTDLPRAELHASFGDFKLEIKDKVTLRRSVSRKARKCRIDFSLVAALLLFWIWRLRGGGSGVIKNSANFDSSGPVKSEF